MESLTSNTERNSEANGAEGVAAGRPVPSAQQGSESVHHDWSFARRPFWLFSHLFALSVVILFIFLGMWQLARHGQRGEENTLIEQRIAAAPIDVLDREDLAETTELEFRPAVVSGTYVEDDFVRVVNRSQGGVAGEHVVGIIELADGSHVAVNRGFAPANADPALDSVSGGFVEVEGWLRTSVSKGRFGVDDSGQGNAVPRLNTDDLAARFGRPLPPVWLQIAGNGDLVATFPDPIPLPAVDAGSHLSYAVQWFTFALLGMLFYGALLWRNAKNGQRMKPAE